MKYANDVDAVRNKLDAFAENRWYILQICRGMKLNECWCLLSATAYNYNDNEIQILCVYLYVCNIHYMHRHRCIQQSILRLEGHYIQTQYIRNIRAAIICNMAVAAGSISQHLPILPL